MQTKMENGKWSYKGIAIEIEPEWVQGMEYVVTQIDQVKRNRLSIILEQKIHLPLIAEIIAKPYPLEPLKQFAAPPLRRAK